jgi:hypothetical protein
MEHISNALGRPRLQGRVPSRHRPPRVMLKSTKEDLEPWRIKEKKKFKIYLTSSGTENS